MLTKKIRKAICNQLIAQAIYNTIKKNQNDKIGTAFAVLKVQRTT